MWQEVFGKTMVKLAQQNNCLKCHSVDKDKDGPAYKKVAEKYKGKADAEKTLAAFLTTNAKIKVDGRDETSEAPECHKLGNRRRVVAEDQPRPDERVSRLHDLCPDARHHLDQRGE